MKEGIDMPRFMIEVEHPPEAMACTRAAQVFENTGSHFLTRADWGCMDGVHTAWIVVEAESREQARRVVPPAYRSGARVVALNAFAMDRLGELLAWHGGGAHGGLR
jgi:hypothetical protein